jgi:glycosyltransferase involved in cell wall biosynthesis
MLKVAVLCHFPPAWFGRYHVPFDSSAVATEIESGAFSTLEGVLCVGLADEPGIELHVITFSKSVASHQQVPFGVNGRLHVLPAPPLSGMSTGWFRRRRVAIRLIRELRPDVVHGLRNLEGYGSMAVKSGFPHVVTPQEFLEQVPHPSHLRFSFAVGAWVERWTVKKAQYLIATTDHVERWVKERSSARLFRIPNIAGEPFYKVGKDQSASSVLYVGRITPEKGLLDLLKALQIANQLGRRIDARVVGGASETPGGGFLQACQDFAHQHLERDQVTFLGWQPSDVIAQLHASSALFVMPSLAPYETMGIVLAEALAAGTPCLVYDFGPMPGMIRHGETGLVVPAGNIQAMANAMITLLNDRQMINAMSAKARLAGEPFRTAAVVRAHLGVYNTIASRT